MPHNRIRILIVAVVFFVVAVLLLGFMVFSQSGSPKLFKISSSSKSNISHQASVIDGKAVAVWTMRLNDKAAKVHAQMIDEQGNILWGDDGKVISSFANSKAHIKLASDSSSVFISWEENNDSQSDIYMQGVDKNGEMLWPAPVAVASGANDQRSQQIQVSDKGILLAWLDYGQKGEIKYQLFDKISGKSILPSAMLASASPYMQTEPRIARLDNGWAIVWQQQSESIGSNIYVQKIDDKGKPLWGEGIPLTTGEENREDASIVSDQAGGLYVVWENVVDINSISAQHIKTDGKLSWDKGGVAVSTVKRTRWHPVALLVEGRLTVVWKEEDKGDDVYSQQFGSNGQRLWGEKGISLSSADKDQAFISSIDKDGRQVVAVWQDARNGGIDVFGQVIDVKGKNLWEKDGKLIFREKEFSQIDPVVASMENNKLFVSWIKTGKSGTGELLGTILETE